MESQVSPKLRKDDRVLVLKVTDGKKSKSSIGTIDPRLFEGTNELHAVRNYNNLWRLKYKFGIVPEALKQQFTSFKDALDAARIYFMKRNIEISEVLD